MECHLRILAFCYLRMSKAHIIHVSGNIASFHQLRYFAYIFLFLYPSSKTLEMHTIGNVNLFLEKEHFSVLLWKKLKNTQKTRFSLCFCSPILFSVHFSVLVTNRLKNSKKTCFKKYRFVTPYRELFMHFVALIHKN